MDTILLIIDLWIFAACRCNVFENKGFKHGSLLSGDNALESYPDVRVLSFIFNFCFFMIALSPLLYLDVKALWVVHFSSATTALMDLKRTRGISFRTKLVTCFFRNYAVA